MEELTIIDVRTYEEFAGGNATGSLNIPLNEISKKLNAIRQLPQPIVLCCASGGRSSQAAAFLQMEGINCINGGSWFEVNSGVKSNKQ